MGEKEEKKRRKSSPIGFRKASVIYDIRVNLSKWGVQIEIFEAGLLLEDATQLAQASWAATSSPFFL